MRCLLLTLMFISSCLSQETRPRDLTNLKTLPIKQIDFPENVPEQPTLPPLDSGWIDLGQLDSTFRFDIRYATTNNFVGLQLYPCPRCILRSEVAAAVVEVQTKLRDMGLSLKFYDCYRPQSIQYELWQKMPDARYVTPPDRGSMHNRGGAVDLTIIDEHGDELDMGTPYDFFGQEAYHTFTGHSPTVQYNRDLLKSLMEAVGFKHIRTEWWHYSYQNTMYPLSDYHWPCPDSQRAWPVE